MELNLILYYVQVKLTNSELCISTILEYHNVTMLKM